MTRSTSDRWYVVATVGYTFGASAGDVGTSYEWKGNWSNVEVGAGGSWYYISSPSTTFKSTALTSIVGMLQLHLGWEF